MATFSFLVLQLIVAICSASKLERVVGGEATTIRDYPMIVQVENLLQSKIWTQGCAGSILTHKLILSAAHCYEEGTGLFSPQERRVRAGSSYRNAGGTIHNVFNYINHPTFGLNDYDGDIALVFLENTLVYSNVVAQASIASSTYPIPDDLQVTHIGWGLTVHPGEASEVLQKVEVLTINNELCRERYEASDPPRAVTTNMMCTGIIDVGGKGACWGDSGGPVLHGSVVVGVVSFGEGCGNKTTPGVNTAIPPYTNWIVENAV